MNEAAPGADARSGCGSSEKGVASHTAGGVPGEDGLGILQLAICMILIPVSVTLCQLWLTAEIFE